MIYTRISTAALNDTTKTDEQERLCREVCERRGWEVGAVFTDLSKSAWNRKVKRPGWTAMLDAIRTGRFGAIVTYWGDRLVRQPRDLEDLLDLRDNHSIRVASIAGQYDFDNPDHLMMMRWEVARACNESDTISRRQKAQYVRLHARGLTRPGGWGGRSFGFEPDGITHVPAETQLVREAAGRVLAGESARAIAADFTARGVRSTAGNAVAPDVLRKMLARPRYAGLMPDGVHQAAWEPVLDRETWEAVGAVLAVRGSRYTFGPVTGRRYLLTGIARCGECRSPMQIRHSSDKRYTGYGCVQPGCMRVQRSVELLDAYVIRRVVNRLARTDNPPGRLASSDAVAGEFRALAEQRTEVEALLADHTKGRAKLLMARLDSLDARLDELRELVAGDAGARLISKHLGTTEPQFRELPLATQRALVSACFEVRVLRASRRGPGFNPADVVLTPR